MHSSALVTEIAVVAVPLLMAVVFHEVAHGTVAYLCGDPTAQRLGRLTLNPLPHVDPVGTLLVPGLLAILPLLTGAPPFFFGWAKPVPIDPRHFRRPRLDQILVALAGPGTNLVLAAACALALTVVPHHFARGSLTEAGVRTLVAGVSVNCVLAVFNLLPIPPLDGGRVVQALLPARSLRAVRSLEGIGMVVVILVVMNTGLVSWLVRPLVHLLLELGTR